MSLAARENSRGRPQLRLVRGAFAPVVSPQPWQKVAAAVLACTHELSRHLLEQRWVRVDECLRERRELLSGLARMPLDAEGRRCLLALEQATEESERAIAGMMGSGGSAR
jgi:hypothetical protein